MTGTESMTVGKLYRAVTSIPALRMKGKPSEFMVRRARALAKEQGWPTDGESEIRWYLAAMAEPDFPQILRWALDLAEEGCGGKVAGNLTTKEAEHLASLYKRYCGRLRPAA